MNKKEFSEDTNTSADSLIKKVKTAAVNTFDQNGDGSLDFKDVSVLVDSVGKTTLKAARTIKNNVEARTFENEMKTLQPIFLEDLEATEFVLPKLIQITEMDKKHSESELCKGSIGFASVQKGLRIVNIYRDKAAFFNLSFYPNTDTGLYYIDPSDRNHYIALDDYFNYMKIVRVTELQRIAQDLGAKHFRVLYKEQQTHSSNGSLKAKLREKAVRGNADFEAVQDMRISDLKSAEIAAENIFPGHAPIEPELHYLQREPAILNLIHMRLNKLSPIQHESFSLSLINSTGIKEKDAMQIDTVLKALKLAGNISITNEIQNEAKRFFQFEVDF